MGGWRGRSWEVMDLLLEAHRECQWVQLHVMGTIPADALSAGILDAELLHELFVATFRGQPAVSPRDEPLTGKRLVNTRVRWPPSLDLSLLAPWAMASTILAGLAAVRLVPRHIEPASIRAFPFHEWQTLATQQAPP